jgi:hypothetical protein
LPLRRAHLALLSALIACPARASEAGLPQEFQGVWVAAGDCVASNDIPGGRVEIGATSLKSAGFSCTLANIGEIPDQQNRQFSVWRHCESDTGVSDARITLYHVDSDVFGEVLATVDRNGSFLTLYKRCPDQNPPPGSSK